ncbi:MAG: class I SAM-dependent methyltransferase [Alphaproteobacteria bacterium]|nr:class I SAM-dependent methyltransferase [Alphaproteobacteria bacterium]
MAIEGPLTIARYMTEALTHPRLGYYARAQPIGAGGDFVTSPEISQMFGELIGLWCADRWQAMGQPSPFALVELGPGRGTLLADALRAGRLVPGFVEAARLHLVEVNPALRALQREKLPAAEWHAHVSELPDAATILLANEYFDALPIRQFQKTDSGWHERLVDHEPETDRLRLVLAPTPASRLVPEVLAQAPLHSVHEIAAPAIAQLRLIAERLAAFGGAALVVDYGYVGPATGETLQAVRRHAFADVLDRPGESDLSAHVDFDALRRAADEAGAEVHGPVGQGEFLRRLGIDARADGLARNAAPDGAAAIRSQHRRLTAESAMGSLFKAMAIQRKGLSMPAGFSA